MRQYPRQLPVDQNGTVTDGIKQEIKNRRKR